MDLLLAPAPPDFVRRQVLVKRTFLFLNIQSHSISWEFPKINVHVETSPYRSCGRNDSMLEIAKVLSTTKDGSMRLQRGEGINNFIATAECSTELRNHTGTTYSLEISSKAAEGLRRLAIPAADAEQRQKARVTSFQRCCCAQSIFSKKAKVFPV